MATMGSMGPRRGGKAPQFSAHVYCGQTARGIKLSLGTEVGLGPGHNGFDGAPAPKEHSPNFRPMSVVAKRLDRSRCHLVGRRPRSSTQGHCVRLGPSSPQRGITPIFGPCLLLPNGWVDQDTTWYRGRPRPRPHCVRAPPKGAQNPLFSVHVYCSQTVAHLSYCSALVMAAL